MANHMEKLQQIKENIEKVMIGNETTIEFVLTALLAKGHVLLEDVPGTGKTVLAKSLAKSVDGEFGRVQFTPDLLPSDIVGLSHLDSRTNEFVFSKGPAFCNILLADEINRATPKTQSSLLECMGERQITVDGVTHPLAAPFLVIATQNSLESLGTFPLPEAQMDRFLMKISMESLDKTQETALIQRFLTDEPLEKLQSVCTCEEIVELQKQCEHVYIHGDLVAYMVDVVQTTRKHAKVASGVSPRGTLAFMRGAQAYAMVKGRDFVTPEDIKSIAPAVLAHRMTMNVSLDATSAANQVLSDVLSSVTVPTEDWSRR